MDSADMVVVVDFGAQYGQLIARRVRECGVYCEIRPYYASLDSICQGNPRGFILTGGPASVYEEGAPRIDPALFHSGVPVLGICYGMQLMAHELGGRVDRGAASEYGNAELFILEEDDLFRGLPAKQQCWMSHGDRVAHPPPGFSVLASTRGAPVAAMADFERKLYGVQFHPEVRHTPWGSEMLKRFLFDVCGCRATWTMKSFIEKKVEEVRSLVGESRVLSALSGGVDSTVAAVIVHRAVKEQLTCVFVDHGLLRLHEAQEVRGALEGLGLRVVYVEAGERFLSRLKGVRDPEQKRQVIGEEFVRVFEEEAAKLGFPEYLVQGTLYPDVIESGTQTAARIKSHHNVGGLPTDMKFKLVEPLRELFKDEVRALGKELGLPGAIVSRQPFPGPGLAVRIVGEVTSEKLSIVRQADAIVREEIARAGLEGDLWQFFAVLLDTKTVGVMGDYRTYAYPVVIRAVVSEDAMTADWAKIPYRVLESISTRITNEVRNVNRVLYDITSKPPATIEWE